MCHLYWEEKVEQEASCPIEVMISSHPFVDRSWFPFFHFLDEIFSWLGKKLQSKPGDNSVDANLMQVVEFVVSFKINQKTCVEAGRMWLLMRIQNLVHELKMAWQKSENDQPKLKAIWHDLSI